VARPGTVTCIAPMAVRSLAQTIARGMFRPASSSDEMTLAPPGVL
jgi:hypothetical protein